MSGWLPVALHTPGWLLLLPLPWLLWPDSNLWNRLQPLLPFPRRRKSENSAASPDHRTAAATGTTKDAAGRLRNFADPHLLPWLLIGPAPAHGSRLTRLVWLLIVLAASGPYLPQAGENARRYGMDVAVVIDISPSMAADDVEPTRLKRAALELRDFSGRLDDDRVALIVFSAYAYRLLPLTHDVELLNYYAGTLDPELTRRHGSNLAQALEYAGQALGEDRTRGRAVVVLSDGETDDRAGALAAAARLKRRGIPVYALGIGTETGAPVPAADGFLHAADGIVISRLDRALLTELTGRSGGIYADARPDDRDWDRLFTGLSALRRSVVLPPQARTGYPLYPWLLAAAFALLLWSGVRRHPAAAIPLYLLFIAGAALPRAGLAAPWQEQAAYDALRKGENDAAATRYEALANYTGWLGRGAAYYRQGQWTQALAAFSAAVEHAGNDDEHATALYDQGTTLARLGRYAEAEQALELSLQLRPNHPRAQLNLNLVRDAIASPPPLPAAVRRHDNAEPVTGTAEATNRRADAAGTRPAVAGAIPRAATAPASSNAPLAPDPDALVSERDRPGAILRHRFLVQDTEHPLGAEGQTW